MSFWTIRTLNEIVTDHSEIGRTKLGGNQGDRENVGKSRALVVEHSPKFTPIFTFGKIGSAFGIVFGGIKGGSI